LRSLGGSKKKHKTGSGAKTAATIFEKNAKELRGMVPEVLKNFKKNRIWQFFSKSI
jgi:hypothetical protein